MPAEPEQLLRRGFVLEGITLGWNVVGVVVVAVAALRARSVALAGFGLDSLVEIAASAVGFGAWWADPAAGLVIVVYGLREAEAILSVQTVSVVPSVRDWKYSTKRLGRGRRHRSAGRSPGCRSRSPVRSGARESARPSARR